MPTAASTRPQLGSEPNSAVLTRLSRATTRAAVSASSSDAAPVTVTTTRLVTPSASACSCAHRSSHTRSTASSRSLWLGAMSLAPEASSSTVSLVEQLPSTSRRSKVIAVARRSARVRASGVGDGVGGDDAQHGGQRRREHARALRHAADRPVVAVVQRNLFRHGVGGHDGPRGLFATGQAAGHLVHDLGDTCQHLVHRQPVADEPGGTHGDLDRAGLGAPVGQRRGDGLCGRVGVLEAHRAGAGVGAAGVEHDCAQTSGGEHLLRPQHRRGLDLVAGEHGRGGVVGTLVEHQREVERTGSLDARRDSGGPETGGRRSHPGCG